ncbi:hypothetical protein C0Q70_08736 [Pomacea canaliculata]|uniref:Protein kinase domain-containing protein n=1 Tax=Pomacea canaliculata TaxID=400727 RepID=A0A2T7P7S8_POMCA|nr:hypothetical protein C0Q70_08736 [Pomacea canaliculata]
MKEMGEVPVNFDHFQILRAIGKGSFGKTRIASARFLSQDYAFLLQAFTKPHCRSLTHFPAAKDPCLWQQANRGTCCVPASLIPLGLTWSLALIHRAGLLFSSFVLAYDVRTQKAEMISAEALIRDRKEDHCRRDGCSDLTSI